MRRVLDNWEGGIRVGGHLINNLRFADNTTIIGASESELAILLERIATISKEYGLHINRSKTKLMFIDRQGTSQRTNELSDLNTVRKFVYLGSQISDDGDCTRSRGRAPSRWSDTVQEATHTTLQAAIHMSQDREVWRKLVTNIAQ
ncbi:reverse transcriptase (RNA-dependent DNA polymerase) domain-containing protein [Phthorimaea operculella]|nr:reverse transcriptase (RNA-dependent DNA polymerase) domain-containing protein [Phthorimaea operculella]